HLGLCYYQEQDFPKAADAFGQVLSRYKEFPHRDAAEFNLALVRYHQASASTKPEDFKKAATAFAEMGKHHPQSPQAAQAGWYQAECLYQADDKPAAVKAYLQVINTHKNSPLLPELYLAVGTTQHELEQYEEAEKSFQTFLSRFGSHAQVPEAKLRLGLVKMRREKFEEAERFFRESAAVKEFPLADFAELQYGQALFHRENYPQAAGIFEGLPNKFPQSTYVADALIAAGKSRYREGKFPEAERSLRKLLAEQKESPHRPEAAYWLGQTLRSLKKSAEAVKVLDTAIADPKVGDFKPQLEFARFEALADAPRQQAQSLKNFADFAARYKDHELANEALYRAARAALELSDFAGGRTHAAAFLARPKSAEHRLWGEVVFIAGECELLEAKPNFPQAEKFYRELITKQPEHPQTPMARVRVGHCLQANNQTDAAIGWLNEALKHLTEKPLQAEAHFLIGRAYATKKQSKPAIDSFKRSRQVDPNWPRGDEVLLSLAVELETDKNPQAAIQELNQLVSKYPQSDLLPRGLSRLGHLKMQTAKWDEAANHYRQLVAKFPEHEFAPAAQYHLGAAYFQKPDYNTAANELSQLLSKWPKSEVAGHGQYLRGASYFHLKQYPNAVQDLKAYLATNPMDVEQKVEAQLTLAQAQSELKDYQNVANTLQTLLKESPKTAKADQAQYELAFAYQNLKQADKATQTFETLATQFPESPLVAEAWFRVGEHRESNAKLDEALKAFQTGFAKAKEPKFRELLLYKIGRVNYDRKAHAEAAQEFKKLLTEFPKSPHHDDAVYLQAEALFALEKPTEAFPLFVQATQNPEKKYHARAHYRAGQCATRGQKWADAEKHFQSVVN
ncbi:MAG: tetratricopeptide repeat protein, partial [Planctomycetaceae bacterium]|nr:tetratricopeptide repeat protein [Planctomycetaceae bacterium]